MSRFFIGIALVLLWAGPGFAQQDAKKKPPTEKQIGELITKLGDARFKVREEAAKKLIEIGKPALPQLRKAARNEAEVEISRRASKIIKIIEDQPPQSRRSHAPRPMHFSMTPSSPIIIRKTRRSTCWMPIV